MELSRTNSHFPDNWGLALNGIYAFMIASPALIITTLIYTAAIFIFGYIFWKFGAWAGGDVKLFTALAALYHFLQHFSVTG